MKRVLSIEISTKSGYISISFNIKEMNENILFATMLYARYYTLYIYIYIYIYVFPHIIQGIIGSLDFFTHLRVGFK